MARSGMRQAGIRIQIEGEKELTAQIKNLRTQFQAFASEVDKVEAEFAGQRNTLKAVEAEYKALHNAMKSLKDLNQTLVQRGAIYQNSLDKETQKLKNLEATIAAVRAQREKAAAAGDTQRVQNLDHLLDSLNLKYIKQKAVVADAEKQVNKNTVELNKNAKTMANLAKEEEFYRRATEDATKSGNGFTKMLDEMGNKTQYADEKLKELAEKAQFDEDMQITRQALDMLTDYFQKLADAVDQCVQSYYEFEKAAISVSKTTPNLSDEEAFALLEDLSDYLPLTRDELAQIASQGGQYGISKQNLEEYSRVMAALASSTNIGVGDLAMVAQLSSLLQVAETDYEKMASTLTDLGNKTRTTEKDTVNMAQTIASTGKIIGLTESEVLGMAAAIAATGGRARGAGTAVNRFMSDMHEAVITGSEELDEYARLAGMSAKEFQKAFQENAMDAIMAVLEGMNKIIVNGGDIYSVFQAIGADSIIEKQNLKNLAMGYEDVAKTIGIANGAWEENTALMTEFGKASATNASQVVLFENKVDGLKNTIGEIWSEDVIEKWRANLGTIIDRIDYQVKENRKNPNTYFRTADSFREENRQYADTQNAFGTTDITIPIMFDFDPKKLVEDPKWITGSEYMVGEFANAVKKAATGVEDPYIAIYNAWVETADKTLHSSGSESPLSQMLDQWNFFIVENQKYLAEIQAQFEKAFDPIKEFSTKGQISLKDFNKNLETNRKAMEDYAHNMALVMADENLSDAFKDYLSSLDISEASKLLSDLAGASDKTKQDVSDNFDAMQQSIADSAAEFGSATGDVTSAIINGIDEADLPGQLFHDGYDSVRGLIRGISNEVLMARLAAASRNLGKIVHTNYNAEQKIQSPSKVMEESAEFDVLGLIKGHQDKEAELRASAVRMAQITRDAYLGSLASMSGGISATINASTRDYTGVLNQISRNTGRNNTVVIEKSGKSSQSTVNDLERALVRGMLY